MLQTTNGLYPAFEAAARAHRGPDIQYLLNVPVIMAGLLIATLPIVAIYLGSPRFFVQGLAAGAIKE